MVLGASLSSDAPVRGTSEISERPRCFVIEPVLLAHIWALVNSYFLLATSPVNFLARCDSENVGLLSTTPYVFLC